MTKAVFFIENSGVLFVSFLGSGISNGLDTIIVSFTSHVCIFGIGFFDRNIWLNNPWKFGTHNFFQIFRICFFKDFIKNPQTTIALTFLTHIISDIDGVMRLVKLAKNKSFLITKLYTQAPERINSIVLCLSRSFGKRKKDIDNKSWGGPVSINSLSLRKRWRCYFFFYEDKADIDHLSILNTLITLSA